VKSSSLASDRKIGYYYLPQSTERSSGTEFSIRETGGSGWLYAGSAVYPGCFAARRPSARSWISPERFNDPETLRAARFPRRQIRIRAIVKTGRQVMASALKAEELQTFREALENLRARLRGDLDQMTDEALQATGNGASGNLSNVPLHMADVGTENYDQEFTLGLIENEQETLDLIYDALNRIRAGTFGHCEACEVMIAKPRLQAIPYAKFCIDCARKMENTA
jgi:RNA polymerase-binding transcription factor DksA